MRAQAVLACGLFFLPVAAAFTFLPSSPPRRPASVSFRPSAAAGRLYSPITTSTTSTRLTAHTTRLSPQDTAPEEHDVIVIGSGIGGLSCASLCAASYGLDVAVCESHEHAGGAAHAFTIKGFHFDSGPSLFSGLSLEASPNPLLHVLQAIDEKVDWITYDVWGVILPYGSFNAQIGPEPFQELLKKYGGPDACDQWKRFMDKISPLSEAAMALPPSVLRNDVGVLLTMGKFWRAVLKTLPSGPQLQLPFSTILDEVQLTDKFIRDWLSLLTFLLQGMTEEGTMTAVLAYMIADWYRPNVKLDYPRGGTGALIDALARGVTKTGGKVYTSAHVAEILLDPNDKNRAVGVRLKNGKILKARKGVVSNASIWDTMRLLPPDADLPALAEYKKEMQGTPQCESFLHLHLGIDAKGLPDDLQCHYAYVDSFERPIESPGNVIIISIPSLLDPSLAPEGCHVIHAYSAGNEPFSLYEGMDRKSPEYEKLKEERTQVLWKAIEKAIPDVRARVKVSLAGTPLTHARFLRRDRGTYGPGIRAGKDQYPPAQTPIPGLSICGDSVFPGIGMPAVAASGCIAANNLVGVGKHLKMLDKIKVE